MLYYVRILNHAYQGLEPNAQKYMLSVHRHIAHCDPCSAKYTKIRKAALKNGISIGPKLIMLKQNEDYLDSLVQSMTE